MIANLKINPYCFLYVSVVKCNNIACLWNLPNNDSISCVYFSFVTKRGRKGPTSRGLCAHFISGWGDKTRNNWQKKKNEWGYLNKMKEKRSTYYLISKKNVKSKNPIWRQYGCRCWLPGSLHCINLLILYSLYSHGFMDTKWWLAGWTYWMSEAEVKTTDYMVMMCNECLRSWILLISSTFSHRASNFLWITFFFRNEKKKVLVIFHFHGCLWRSCATFFSSIIWLGVIGGMNYILSVIIKGVYV